MKNQQNVRLTRKLVAYRVAKWTWLITTWIWTSIILAFLIQYIPALLTGQNPAASLRQNLAVWILLWLRSPNTTGYLEILRVAVLSVALLLVILPLVAFIVKQVLQNVQLEGFDKLFDILQQDNISPKLEDIQGQIQQHLDKQDVIINSLFDMSRVVPIITRIECLYQLLQRQLQTQDRIVQLLQDMSGSCQQNTTAILQTLDDRYAQKQKEQMEILQNIQKLSYEFKAAVTELNMFSSLIEHDNDPQLSQINPGIGIPPGLPLVQAEQLVQVGANLASDNVPSVQTKSSDIQQERA